MLVQMKTTIRWAKPTDLESLLEIDALANKEFPDWWSRIKASDLKKLIGKSKSNILAAVVDGRIVGFLRGELSAKDKLTIEDIFIMKQLRGKGIGKRMVKAFLKKWKGRAASVGLHTKDFNVKRFERMGFEKKMSFMSRKL